MSGVGKRSSFAGLVLSLAGVVAVAACSQTSNSVVASPPDLSADIAALAAAAAANPQSPTPDHPVISLSGTQTNHLAVRVTPVVPGRTYTVTLRGSHWQNAHSLRVAVDSYGQDAQVTAPAGTYSATLHSGKDFSSATSNSYEYLPGQSTIPEAPLAADQPLTQGRYIQDQDFTYYLPTGYVASGHAYPAVVAFSPGLFDFSRGAYDGALHDAADKYGFIIMNSKYYHNLPLPIPGSSTKYNALPDNASLGMAYCDDKWLASGYCHTPNAPVLLDEGYGNAMQQIQTALTKLPIDRSRIVLQGQSGGTSFAHALNIQYPGVAAAMILNTGMIWDGASNGPDWRGYLQKVRTPANYQKSRKLAYFLESPTDFRYPQMHGDATYPGDANLYRAKGWTVQELSFDGGHAVAPPNLYNQVFADLTTQPGWQ